MTVTSASPGTGTLTVTSVTDGAFVVDLTRVGDVGRAASQVVPLTATKTWLGYRVSLDAPATNLVGVPHTFDGDGGAVGGRDNVVAGAGRHDVDRTTSGTGTLDTAPRRA